MNFYINHLKTHKILIVHNENANNPKKPSPKKTTTANSILQYMKAETIDEIISRYIAEDGFSINVVITSQL